MAYIKGANREQMLLLPECVEEYVSAENPARLIDAFVESLDMAALGFKAKAAVEGRPGYDPKDMLKLYIYGYLNRIRSSRKLQTEAGRNLELIWLLKRIVPDFRCIADFRKDYAKGIRNVFGEFVKLCDKGKLLSHETVVIDGSKFRAVNSDNNCLVKSNVSKLIAQAEDRMAKYMAELDECDQAERRPEQLTKDEIQDILGYLEQRKAQLKEGLAQIDASGENHICVTDTECRLMRTRDGYKPSFNVQTAVEADHHIIVHYDVSSDCVDWNLLEDGINGAKKALRVETIEGIADKGYSCDEETLKCLLNGDTPTIYPNSGEACRTFQFKKERASITPEMLVSRDHEVLKQCIAAGVLPEILKRGDVTMETVERVVPHPSQYVQKETGEIVSREEMIAAGGNHRDEVEIHREPPVQPYFERDPETDTVVCPMGQTLLYAGPGQPNGVKDETIRRYHRAAACKHCPNKCTLEKRRVVSFKEDEARVEEPFYERCKAGRITRRTNHDFKRIAAKAEYETWVVIRYYPNQRRLRLRNRIVEHPYGTVKRWNDAGYLLTIGKVKTAAELALSFLAYDFKRAVNILGFTALLTLIHA